MIQRLPPFRRVEFVIQISGDSTIKKKKLIREISILNQGCDLSYSVSCDYVK